MHDVCGPLRTWNWVLRLTSLTFVMTGELRSFMDTRMEYRFRCRFWIVIGSNGKSRNLLNIRNGRKRFSIKMEWRWNCDIAINSVHQWERTNCISNKLIASRNSSNEMLFQNAFHSIIKTPFRLNDNLKTAPWRNHPPTERSNITRSIENPLSQFHRKRKKGALDADGYTVASSEHEWIPEN